MSHVDGGLFYAMTLFFTVLETPPLSLYIFSFAVSTTLLRPCNCSAFIISLDNILMKMRSTISELE